MTTIIGRLQPGVIARAATADSTQYWLQFEGSAILPFPSTGKILLDINFEKPLVGGVVRLQPRAGQAKIDITTAGESMLRRIVDTAVFSGVSVARPSDNSAAIIVITPM